MRMNLGEISLSLGCTPETFSGIPRDTGFREGGPRAASGGDSGFLSGLSSQRIRGEQLCVPFEGYNDESEGKMPWTAVVPTGGSMDSRSVKPGDLFFCLPGERADGHDFASDAARAGACAIIAARDPFRNMNGAGEDTASLPPVFLVEDPLKALWRLAVCHRNTTGARVIGVTGTAGKTTVKEVLGQMLAQRGHTERNPMNLNNQIGLPLSMLNASADALFWVMEVGISEAPDMDELGQVLRPDVALILNVGEAHLNGLGERGVAANKALLLDYIQSGGLALVSADYPDLLAEVEKRGNVFAEMDVDLAFFSTVSRNVFSWAEYLGQRSDFSGQYRVLVGGRECCVRACFQGDFGSENVAAIAAAAVKMGLRAGEIAQGFSDARLPEQRFNCRRYGDIILVDDSYNANPLSSMRMIRSCRSMADYFGMPLYLVMGEMLELGDRTEEAHEELGRIMADALPAKVFWKGGQAEAVLSGLRRSGYGKDFYPVSGGQEFSLLLEEFDPQSGLFLFKGSRRNNLERLAGILRERVDTTGGADAV